MSLKNLKINEDLHRRIKMFCAARGISIKDFVLQALSAALEE